MVDDALYLLAKVERTTGTDQLKYLRQLHLMIEAEIIVQRIRTAS